MGGALEADTKMPSVRSLAVELSVNPNTIQRAYMMLEQAGYLYTISGRGNFVAPESEWRGSKVQEMVKECREKLLLGREAGVTREQLLNLVNTIFEEAGND